MNTVTIINKYWNSLHIQVRIGNNANAEDNPLVYDAIMPMNSQQIFNFPISLFYRREINPDNPTGIFTMWSQCFTTITIDNP